MNPIYMFDFEPCWCPFSRTCARRCLVTACHARVDILYCRTHAHDMHAHTRFSSSWSVRAGFRSKHSQTCSWFRRCYGASCYVLRMSKKHAILHGRKSRRTVLGAKTEGRTRENRCSLNQVPGTHTSKYVLFNSFVSRVCRCPRSATFPGQNSFKRVSSPDCEGHRSENACECQISATSIIART